MYKEMATTYLKTAAVQDGLSKLVLSMSAKYVCINITALVYSNNLAFFQNT